MHGYLGTHGIDVENHEIAWSKFSKEIRLNYECFHMLRTSTRGLMQTFFKASVVYLIILSIHVSRPGDEPRHLDTV